MNDETAEAALAHRAASTTRQRYRHSDLLMPRGPLMQAWGDYVLPLEDE